MTLCRVCDSALKETDQQFLKSLGTKCYFHVTCSNCQAEYACDELGTVVRFTFGEPSRTLSPNDASVIG